MNNKEIAKRISFFISIFFIFLFFPFEVGVFFLIITFFYVRFFVEGVVLMFMFESLYGVPMILNNKEYVLLFSFLVIIVFIILEYLKTKIRS